MYKKPFKYDDGLQMITDSNGLQLLQMRGWSQLNKLLPVNTVLDLQDHMGEIIVDLLNENLEISERIANGKREVTLTYLI